MGISLFQGIFTTKLNSTNIHVQNMSLLPPLREAAHYSRHPVFTRAQSFARAMYVRRDLDPWKFLDVCSQCYAIFCSNCCAISISSNRHLFSILYENWYQFVHYLAKFKNNKSYFCLLVEVLTLFRSLQIRWGVQMFIIQIHKPVCGYILYIIVLYTVYCNLICVYGNTIHVHGNTN